MIYHITLLHTPISFGNYAIEKLPMQSGKLSYLFTLLLFVVLVLLFVRRTKSTEFLRFENTEQMKGIAIILVILSHIFSHLLDVPETHDIFFIWGKIGVALFLLLSGFGITRSYLAKGLGKNWLIKRYLTLWVPYIIVTVIWFVLDAVLLNLKHSSVDILSTIMAFPLKDDWSVVDFNMWFIPYILVQYAIFYIVFRLQNINKNIKLLITAIGIALASYVQVLLLQKYIQPLLGWPVEYSIYFPLGIVVAFYYDGLKKMISSLNLRDSMFFFSLICALAIIQSYFLLNNVFWSVVFFLALFAIINRLKLASRFLSFIGFISFEIYLVHGPLMYRYDFIFYKEPIYLTFPIYLAVVIILAILLNYISTKILTYLKLSKSSSEYHR